MLDVKDAWDWDVEEEEIDDENELTLDEEFAEEVKFWGYQSRWPEKSFSLENKNNKNIKEKNMTQVSVVDSYQKDLDTFRVLAKEAFKSGNYGGLTESTLLNIMLSARDLGISPYKAINGGFNIIKGKICMSTALMTDRIRKDGHSVKIPEWTLEKCIIIGIRKDNGDSVKVEFNMDDAAKAGLKNSGSWKAYPKAMLYNRAMSTLARVLFPDVVGNCYSEDEGEEIQQGFKKRNAPEEPLKEIEVMPEMMLSEIKEIIEKNIEVSHKEYLEEYLVFCKERVQKPMEEVMRSWLDNPEPFKNHYSKWVDKKLIEKNPPTEDTGDREPSLFEEHA